ncbi:hypothetical protein [Streptomyces alanosinicus]|uniref:hypothetical protein n=1 Tax=Streptomyces alanosinicus TaxID=68171 RepID=UPI00167C2FDE|nr:hypothetical protein [Streptomyces alanosinicus]
MDIAREVVATTGWPSLIPPADRDGAPRPLLLGRMLGLAKGLLACLALESQVDADRVFLRDLSIEVRQDRPKSGRVRGRSDMACTVQRRPARRPLALPIRVEQHLRRQHEPITGRVALELSFPGGRVRCERGAGDLRLILM